MTPSELRDQIAGVQDRLRDIESLVEKQKSVSSAYPSVIFELVEAWEATERAIEFLDEMAMGLT